MFFYATSAKFKHNLTLVKLSAINTDKSIDQIAQWMEKQWGYVRGFPGLDFRRDQIKTKFINNLYVLMYAGEMIGMFALFDYEGLSKKTKAKELMSFYIDESFRGLGIGRKMMEMAKNKCQEDGAELLILDTLNPNLNHFYEKSGAADICESRFVKEPTSLLSIKLK